MTIGIVIATHGMLARELLNTSQMLFGRTENLITICYMPEHSIDTLLENMLNALNEMREMKVVIIFCDMKGGSPCNIALRMAKTDNRVKVVSGVNIPVLLELLSLRDDESSVDVIIELEHVIYNSVEILNKE